MPRALREPVSARCPEPTPCGWCSGAGTEPFDDSGVRCFECGGCGYGPCDGDLGPTRTHPRGRPFTYEPGRRRLSVTRGRTTTHYALTELVPDPRGWDGRAWEVVREDTGEVRHAFVPRAGDRHECTCQGETYKASERANERAAAESRELVPTAGCVHLDALLTLLRAGWLDIADADAGSDVNILEAAH